jgi:hypothetical protein
MTQPVSDGTGDDFDLDLDAPLNLTDYIEITCDALDEAVDRLEPPEIDQLCAAIRKKISEMLRENRRSEPERPATEPPERDDGYRWWDR